MAARTALDRLLFVMRTRLLTFTLLLLGCDELTPPLMDAGPDDKSQQLPPLDPISIAFEPVTFPQAPMRTQLVAHDGALLSVSTQGVDRSDDHGASWTRVSGSFPEDLTSDGRGALWARTSAALLRSDDGGATFQERPLPADLAAAGRLFITRDGAVWLLSQAAPFLLARSTDGGATFAPALALEGAALAACAPLGDAIAFLIDGATLVRVRDTEVEVLGAVSGAASCATTPGGAVLVSGYDTSTYELRFIDALTAPVRTETSQRWRYQTAGDALVRYGFGGAVELSADDGVSFTAREAAAPDNMTVSVLVAIADAFIALTTLGPAALEGEASTWVVHAQAGLPPFVSVRALSFARESPGIALLVDDNIQRTLFVALDGVTFVRGQGFAQAEANAVALHPRDDRVVVAGIYGSYRILGDGGRTVLRAGQINTIAGEVDVDPIREVLWEPDPAGSVVLAGTATDDDTRGRLWQLDGEADDNTWRSLTPARTATSAALRPGGFHALAASHFEPGQNRALTLSHRSFVSAGSFTTKVLMQSQLFNNNSDWVEADAPVGFTPALSASYAHNWLDGVAMLWSENRLRYGRTGDRLHEVILDPPGLPELRVVRFAPDGRLWLGTANGVWRSTAPLALPASR